LVRDTAGNLYGTTSAGGSSYGVVFKVNKSGKETVLHSFAGSDGSYTRGAVIRDANGELYGTAQAGGSFGYGRVFKVDGSGTETTLYSFAGGTTDGCYPYGGLLRDAAGNLYGTTSQCGGTSNAGTVFKLSKSGKETVLHSFTGMGHLQSSQRCLWTRKATSMASPIRVVLLGTERCTS